MQTIKKLLFQNEAVEGINKPTDYPYLKILRWNLLLLSSWPHKQLGENLNKFGVAFGVIFIVALNFNIVCGITGPLYIKLHLHELTFYQLGHVYITMFMNLVTISRIFTLPFSKKYMEVVTRFLTEMHLFFSKEESEFAMQTHRRVHLICHLFTIFLTNQMFGGLCLYNLIPIYSNYSSGKYSERNLVNSTYEHALYFEVPINGATDFYGYLTVAFFNFGLSYICSINFCMLDLLLSLMIFHTWGHYNILLHELASFPLPAAITKSDFGQKNTPINAAMYTEEESLVIAQKLKKCIDYHRRIANFTESISEAFGVMLFVYYIIHQCSGCLLLLECSQMTTQALVRYLPLTVIMFQQLIQLSVIFELIGTVTEKLKDGVYQVPWQYMDVVNRKTVHIFLMNVQEPVHVKALGLADVGVTTMIIKASFSYFAFLQTTKTDAE